MVHFESFCKRYGSRWNLFWAWDIQYRLLKRLSFLPELPCTFVKKQLSRMCESACGIFICSIDLCVYSFASNSLSWLTAYRNPRDQPVWVLQLSSFLSKLFPGQFSSSSYKYYKQLTNISKTSSWDFQVDFFGFVNQFGDNWPVNNNNIDTIQNTVSLSISLSFFDFSHVL